MIRFASAPFLVALAMAAMPVAAQEAARDFQLPPAPAPTQESRVQGPVDTEGVVPIRPRAIQTTRPAASTPAPNAATAPTIVLPTPAATGSSVPARTRGAPSPSQAVRGPATNPPAVSTPLAPIGETSQPAPSATSLPVPTMSIPAPQSSVAPTAQQSPPLPWLWIVLGLVSVAGAAGLLLLRYRRARQEPPTIIAPQVPLANALPGAVSEALAISVEAVRMDRSVMNATVGYRVTLRNRTAQALSAVSIEADLVSASKDQPAEAQLASPANALTPRHATERLAPGQSLRFEGQVRLPLSEASAIWQGRVGLLVPLLRVRATASGAEPIATTLVIGRREGTAARPQPFRLDEPPRSYAPLAQRVLDAVPARA